MRNATLHRFASLLVSLLWALLASRRGLVFTGGDERSAVPRLRRVDGQAALGVSDELGHPGAADLICDRREAVHRVGVGVGRRLARDAGDPQSALSRRLSR